MSSALPPTYNAAAVARVLERIALGESVTAACKAEGLARQTFADWVELDVDGLASRSARAVAAGCDALADQCLAIADTPLEGEETTTKADGSVEVKRGDMLGHRRLQIDTRMRLLGKWLPKKYGDRQELHHTADESIATAIVAARQRSGA